MPSKCLNLVKLLMVNIYRDLLAWGSPYRTGVIKRDTIVKPDCFLILPVALLLALLPLLQKSSFENQPSDAWSLISEPVWQHWHFYQSLYRPLTKQLMMSGNLFPDQVSILIKVVDRKCAQHDSLLFIVWLDVPSLSWTYPKLLLSVLTNLELVLNKLRKFSILPRSPTIIKITYMSPGTSCKFLEQVPMQSGKISDEQSNRRVSQFYDMLVLHPSQREWNWWKFWLLQPYCLLSARTMICPQWTNSNLSLYLIGLL